MPPATPDVTPTEFSNAHTGRGRATFVLAAFLSAIATPVLAEGGAGGNTGGAGVGGAGGSDNSSTLSTGGSGFPGAEGGGGGGGGAGSPGGSGGNGGNDGTHCCGGAGGQGAYNGSPGGQGTDGGGGGGGGGATAGYFGTTAPAATAVGGQGGTGGGGSPDTERYGGGGGGGGAGGYGAIIESGTQAGVIGVNVTAGSGGNGGQGGATIASPPGNGGGGGSGGVGLQFNGPGQIGLASSFTITGGNGGDAGQAGVRSIGTVVGLSGSAGTAGDGAQLGGPGSLTNNGTIKGGIGGSGPASRGGIGLDGAGGNGGNGVTLANGGSLNNFSSITGGNGGVGGSGGGFGGNGGSGVQLSGNGGSVTNSGTITGGTGGAFAPASAGGGGTGGTGVSFTGNGGSLTNNGTIKGGNGGFANVGTNNGFGGIGVAVVNGSVINNNTISGGNGANSLLAPYPPGGVGMSVSNGAVINNGTISGGFGGNSGPQANAIVFGGGNNKLELWANSTINGNVVASSGSNDTLALGGAANGTFNVGAIGAQYQGFENFEKTGTSTWTLTGTTGAATPWAINQGTLSISQDASLGASSGLSFDGGALQNTSAFTTGRAITLAARGGTFTTVADLTASGIISGPSALTKNGAATLILTADNTYAGGTIITAGTLQVGDGGTSGSILGNVTNNGTLAFNRSDNITFGNAVGGSGMLVQLGGGLLTLTAENTYSGNTIVAAGSLQVGNGGTTGSIVGDVLNNGSLAFDRADDIVYGGAVSGNGVLVKAGAGSLTLTGNSTYTGNTLVAFGTLNVAGSLGQTAVGVASGATLMGSGSIGGPVTVQSGGTLSGASGTTLGLGTLTLNAGAVTNVLVNAPSATLFNVSGNLTAAGTINVATTGGYGPGVYRVVEYGGMFTNNGLALGVTPAGFVTVLNTATAQQLNITVYSDPTQTQFWQGGSSPAGGSGAWSASNPNWLNADSSQSTVWGGVQGIFHGTPGTVTVEGAQTFRSLEFVVGGYTLVAGNAGALTPTGTAQLWAEGARTTATIAAPIVGPGGIVKVGAGTIVLAAANSYAGGTTIDAGTLSISSDANLGAASGGLTFNGGTLENTAALTTARAITLNRTGTLATTGDLTATGVISGAGALTKAGSGRLTLGGNNTYSGGTIIHAGTVTVSVDANLGAASGGLVFHGGTLHNTAAFTTARAVTLHAGATFHTGADLTLAGAIGGAGTLIKAGEHRLTLTGSNSYAGGTIITAGTLQVGDGGTSGSILGNITNNGTLAFNRSDNITVGNAVGGSGMLAQLSSGLLTLTAENTYSGNTIIAAGSLQIGNGGTSGSIVGDVLNNGSLTFNRADDIAYGGAVSGNGVLVKSGAGVLTLTGNSTYTGNTLVAFGALNVAGSLGQTSVSVGSGTTLLGSGSIGGPVTVQSGGVLSGASGTTLGLGTLTLNAGAVTNVLVNGPGPTLFDVRGNLTATGTLNVATTGGYGPGVYRVIGYGGSFTNNGLALGATPAGFVTVLDTATAQQLNITVYSDPTQTQFWQGGSNPAGGSGTWSASNPNWLNADSSQSTFWGGVQGIFHGTPGTVTVEGTQAFRSLEFVVGGYTLVAGNAGALTPTGTAQLWAEGARTTATIAAPIVGPGGIVKVGAGTIVLAAANSYTGGTTIDAGTLSISSDANLGAASGGLVFHGGTLHNTAAFTTARTVTLHAGATFHTGADLTLSSAIGGAGTLIKAGEHRLTLTGSNSYTGSTIITAGTVQIGSGGTSGSILGDVASNGTLAFNRSDNVTFGGTVSGSGMLVQLGKGILTLTGNNTYSGSTIVAAGSLEIGNGGTTGSIAGNVLNNGSLAFNRADDIAYGGAISGNGVFVKNGAGLLTMTGNSSYTGNTLVAFGTLNVAGSLGQTAVGVASGATLKGSGSISGPVTVQNGGILSGAGGTTFRLGALTLNGGAVTNVLVNGPGLVPFDVAGNLTAGGTLNVATTGAYGPGVYHVVEYGGTFTNDGLALGVTPAGFVTVLNTATAQQLNITVYSDPTQTQFWQGGSSPAGGSGAWSASNPNWLNADSSQSTFWGGVQGIFHGTPGTVTVEGAQTFRSLEFVVGGYTLVAGNAGALTPTGTAQLWAEGARTTATIAASIVGPGGIAKIGAGTIVLAAANSYAGGTTIDAGTLSISSDANLGAASGSLTFNGGALHNTAAFTTARAITFNRTGTLATTGDLTATGVISGAGALTKAGSGRLTLVGNNTYSGGTIIHAGTVAASADANLGAASGGLVFHGGTLHNTAAFATAREVTLHAGATFHTGADLTLSSAVGGGGTLIKAGEHRLTLTGSNSYASGTIIIAGTLRVGDGGTTGSILGNVANSGLLAFDRSDALTYSGSVSGTGGLAKFGTGTLILTGNSTYAGGTTIHAGTLQIGNGGAGGSIVGDITNNGTLAVDSASNLVLAGAIAGSGALTKSGSGTLLLAGNNSYGGGTSVTQGTLAISSDGNLGASSGGLTLNSGELLPTTSLATARAITLGPGGGNFLTPAGVTLSASGVLSGPGALTLAGGGTLSLGGINTYTGPTTVSSGSLVVNGSIASSSSLSVDPAGSVGGTGALPSTTINGGMLAPGNSIGTLSVQGNYTQNGGTYQVELSPAAADRLNATGSAFINGGTVQLAATSGSYANNTTYTIVNATGGVSGAYANVTEDFAFLTPILSYDTNNVFLTLALLQNAFSFGGNTPNEKAVGYALDRSFANATGDFATVIAALAGLSTAQGPLALNTISGQPWANFGTMNVATGAMFMNTLGQQMALARGGAAGGQRLALGQACGTEACDGPGPWSAWLSAVGGLGSVQGNRNASTFTYNAGGAAASLDYRFDPRFLAGLSVGYTHGTQWTNGFMGQGWSDTVSAAVYGSFTQAAFYVDALAGFAWSTNQLQRQIVIPNLQPRTANGSAGASQFLGQAEAGYRIGLYAPAQATVTPFARLQIQSVTQYAFSESGASSLSLNVAQQGTSSLRSTIGAELAGKLALGSESKLALALRLGWLHEYDDTSRPISPAFAGAPGNGFTVYGATPARDSAVLGFQASTSVADAASVYLRYDGEVGSGTDNHAVSLGLRISW